MFDVAAFPCRSLLMCSILQLQTQGTISAHLSGSRMKIAPPGPGLAQLLCLIFINSQNAASFEASLQQQHTVAPQALKALSGHTPARLFRMHTCLSNTISHIKRAQNLVLPQRQIFHAVSSVLKRSGPGSVIVLNAPDIPK
ncbi:MAG: hypothetical protein FRX49_04158 [Trebouxia sp. A1-2]|nr:MAG: hypothetical protein FRX49_04158 [Trebouxia sp. A1-2]